MIALILEACAYALAIYAVYRIVLDVVDTVWPVR